MSKIKVLDSLTIQKIAAGEVVERPASIVKELVENSIDAGANQIIVEVSDGGRDFIRVTDNGEGMDENDLKLAFKRHTTSKLHSVEDLSRIITMGFRGEALSSICAVSKIEVFTRQEGMNSGLKGFVEDGLLKSITPTGTPIGTTMIIRKLFYNLPVRKRFMKSKTSESNAITETVTRLAVGNPSLSFKYIKDNKVVFNSTATGDVKNSIYQLLGKDLTKGLQKISIKTEDFKINGYISYNHLYRSNRHHQYLYVNGRYVIDYRFSKIIEKQYISLIPINRYPVFVLFVEIDPSDVDVNIHPTKQEIKFTNQSNIYQKLEAALRNNIGSLLRVPKADLYNDSKETKDDIPTIWDLENSLSKEINTANMDEVMVDKDSIVFVDYSSIDINDQMHKEFNEEIIEYKEVDKFDSKLQPKFIFTNLKVVGIAFKTYLFTEDMLSSTLYVLDQHAAHERVMYEKLLNEFRNESIYIQQLLQPIVIDLGQLDFSKACDNIDHFKKVGFQIEIFGDRSIILRGVPMIFGDPDSKKLFMDILDQLDDKLPTSYETRIEKIIKLSCSSAIKAGDTMSDLETNALLKQLEGCENPYTCPHGRPTIIEITKKELEKKFHRIQ